ncbi:MAG: class I SAM-dependent rRNA methyltransferase [Planctomycetes bacterium]|nr:class I SAM-dependent rRNA methyltransferase [Planctomycetota bacterium]
MSRITLTGKGRRWLENGHPWAFADDLATVEAEPGDVVRVEGPNGLVLGHALFSQGSKIAVRMVTRSKEAPDRAFWQRRIERAVAARAAMGFLDPMDACRLVAGDSEGVPGLVVDRYADVLVCQSGTQGADRLRDLVLELVERALPWKVRAIVDRSDASVRRFENLEKKVEVVRGTVPAELVVRERIDARARSSSSSHGSELLYEVDVLAGHKTGHYLDQRANRTKAAAFAKDARVLDAFCYDGLFGVRAALAGAKEVVCLDQSQPALERAQRNAERNGVADRVRTERADCMDALRMRAQAGERFDLVVVDPPAFAKNKRELDGAARGYTELNRRAMELVREGGRLVTASCSYNVRPELFVDFLRASATRALRFAWLEELAGASPDHPQLLTLPESAYLKCAFLRVGEPDSIQPPETAHDGEGPGQRRDA